MRPSATWLRLRQQHGQCTLKHILRQTFEGLAALHARGVTHRDLKPANTILRIGGAAGAPPGPREGMSSASRGSRGHAADEDDADDDADDDAEEGGEEWGEEGGEEGEEEGDGRGEEGGEKSRGALVGRSTAEGIVSRLRALAAPAGNGDGADEDRSSSRRGGGGGNGASPSGGGGGGGRRRGGGHGGGVGGASGGGDGSGPLPAVRLADFGSAVDAEVLQPRVGLYPNGASVEEETGGYQPPESTIGGDAYASDAPTSYDLWSMGVIILELLLGTPSVLQLSSRAEAALRVRFADQPPDLLAKLLLANAYAEHCILPPRDDSPAATGEGGDAAAATGGGSDAAATGKGSGAAAATGMGDTAATGKGSGAAAATGMGDTAATGEDDLDAPEGSTAAGGTAGTAAGGAAGGSVGGAAGGAAGGGAMVRGDGTAAPAASTASAATAGSSATAASNSDPKAAPHYSERGGGRRRGAAGLGRACGRAQFFAAVERADPLGRLGGIRGRSVPLDEDLLDLAWRLLRWSPHERLSAEEALAHPALQPSVGLRAAGGGDRGGGGGGGGGGGDRGGGGGGGGGSRGTNPWRASQLGRALDWLLKPPAAAAQQPQPKLQERQGELGTASQVASSTEQKLRDRSQRRGGDHLWPMECPAEFAPPS